MDPRTLAELVIVANSGALDPNHPTIDLGVGDIKVPVDEQIAPLILRLWRAGIATQASCQGDVGHEAYIAFPGLRYAQAFLRRCPAAVETARARWISDEGSVEELTCEEALLYQGGDAAFWGIYFASSDLERIEKSFA